MRRVFAPALDLRLLAPGRRLPQVAVVAPLPPVREAPAALVVQLPQLVQMGTRTAR